MLDIGLFFFVWKENSRGDSDEYHIFLQFLILDLHKSEVGPSNIYIFFSKMKLLLKKINIDFIRPFYPSTPGLQLYCH